VAQEDALFRHASVDFSALETSFIAISLRPGRSGPAGVVDGVFGRAGTAETGAATSADVAVQRATNSALMARSRR
jgi:hypothetical protein